jgi:hypothetical protein
VSGYEPARLDVETVEKGQQARSSHLASENTAGDITGRFGSAIGTKPTSHGIEVDTKRNEDLFVRHGNPL